MNFLAPWGFWFLLLVPVVLLFYLFRTRPEVTQVSTLEFWQEVIKSYPTRHFFLRFRRLFSLLLNLLILGLLLFALVRPEPSGWENLPAATVVVLDGRLPMQAKREDQKNDFEVAKNKVLEIIRTATPHHQVGLIVMENQPRVLAPLSANPNTLRELLMKVSATDTNGEIQAAVKLAEQIAFSYEGESEVLVVTNVNDETIEEVNKDEGEENKNVQWVSVGYARPNLALRQFQARRLVNSPQTVEFFLTVSNFNSQPEEVDLEITWEEQLFEARSFTIPAGETRSVVIPVVLDQPLENSVSMKANMIPRRAERDFLSEDNVRFLLLQPSPPARVLLVSDGNRYLENFLKADYQVEYEYLNRESFRWEMAKLFDVVIVDGAMEGWGARDEWEDGVRILSFGLNGEGVTETKLENPVVTHVMGNHDVVRLGEFERIQIQETQVLERHLPGWSQDILVEANYEPVIMTRWKKEEEKEEVRWIQVGFKLEESDFARRVAFPVFMSQAVQWLKKEESEMTGTYLAGEWVGAGNDAQKDNVSSQKSFLKAGIYSENQNIERKIAIQPDTRQETNLSGDGQKEVFEKKEKNWTLNVLGIYPWWWILAFCGLIFSSVEWILFNRRRTE